MICKNCNAPLSAQAQFCNKCGTAVGSNITPAEAKAKRAFPLKKIGIFAGCAFAVFFVVFIAQGIISESVFNEARQILHNNSAAQAYTHDGLIDGTFTGWAQIQDGLPTGHGVFTGVLPNGNEIRISALDWQAGETNGQTGIEVFAHSQLTRAPIHDEAASLARVQQNVDGASGWFRSFNASRDLCVIYAEFAHIMPHLVQIFSGYTTDGQIETGNILRITANDMGETRILVGRYEQGQVEGPGALRIDCPLGTRQLYEGMFANGEKNGAGTLTTICAQQSLQRFEGTFENGGRHGEGVLTVAYFHRSAFNAGIFTRRLQNSLSNWNNAHQQTNPQNYITMSRWIAVFNEISTELKRVYNVRFINNRLDIHSISGFTFYGTDVRFEGLFTGFTPSWGRLIFGNTALSYEGAVNAFGQPHGSGTVTGCVLNFSGFLENGSPQGHGTLTFPSGHRVTGRWDGLFFEDGVRYARQFLQGGQFEDAIFDGPMLPRTHNVTRRGFITRTVGRSGLVDATYQGTVNNTTTWNLTEAR